MVANLAICPSDLGGRPHPCLDWFNSSGSLENWRVTSVRPGTALNTARSVRNRIGIATYSLRHIFGELTGTAPRTVWKAARSLIMGGDRHLSSPHIFGEFSRTASGTVSKADHSMMNWIGLDTLVLRNISRYGV